MSHIHMSYLNLHHTWLIGGGGRGGGWGVFRLLTQRNININ